MGGRSRQKDLCEQRPRGVTGLLACLEKKLKVKSLEKQVWDGTNGL